ncbi:hypothetical protein ALC62_05119 [Cyphomyrmex costatus]|uniref:Uncharacterized protein n=1 Tax=Cyphomyrmex costatus TaxID=456900 RepID=A0A195CUJ3_9HYME|nr:hypothetical protein ALC62_05119 [Cyphomyrmex costatus]
MFLSSVQVSLTFVNDSLLNTVTESRVTIMLNVDKLSSPQKENCFIQEAVIIIKWII